MGRKARRATAIESLERRLFLSAAVKSAAPSVSTTFTAPPDPTVQHMKWAGRDVTVRPGEWIVHLAPPKSGRGAADPSDIVQLLQRRRPGVQVTSTLGNDSTLVTAPADLSHLALARTLQSLRGFKYVEPNFVYSADATIPNDPLFGQLWGLNNTGQSGGTVDADIDAPEAWDTTTGSNSVVVAVIDSGVDYNHPDLAANIWTNPGEIAGNGIDDDHDGFVDDVHGYDFLGAGDSDPMDEFGHGTHVAGTIAAVGNNGVGVTGVSWNARIMAIKFLDNKGNGDTADAIEAINYATMMRQRGVNIRLTNNSWSGGNFSQALSDAIAASGSAGMLFVAAAGNNGTNNDASPEYPASYNLPNIISVAALDRKNARASFSNYGATTVDIGAPGVQIRSTVPTSTSIGDPSGYGLLSGTSMATPHVSGVAALAWGIAPNATYAQVRDAIYAGGDSVASLAGKTVTGKRLNAKNTIDLLSFQVQATTPAAGTVVSTAPTQFRVDFTAAFNSATLQPSDLTVNGIAATSITLVDADTAQFSYASTPVTTQGVQTIAMAAGAVAKSSDGALLGAYSGTFRYDAIPLAVSASTPAAGTSAPPPMTSLRLTFNEDVAAGSVSASDLQLSAGSVAGFSIIDTRTIQFALSGLTTDGAVTASTAAGALTDAFGNGGTSWTGTFNLVSASAVPARPDLIATSDSGFSDSDDITNLDNSTTAGALHFSVGSTIVGATVRLYSDGTLIGSVLAGSTTTEVVTDPLLVNLTEGVHQFTARQSESGRPESTASAALPVTVDLTSPAAQATLTNVTTSGGTQYAFTVRFTDGLGIDMSTLDGSDVKVTGSAGFSQLASLTSTDIPSNGTPRTATYRIDAPGGSWDTADDGIYSATLLSSQVRDVAGNAAASGILGTFSVDVPPTSSRPDLLPASDSGGSSSDDLTNFNNAADSPLQFSIPGTFAGMKVSLYADGKFINSVTAAGSTTLLTTAGDRMLADGLHQLTVRQTPATPGSAEGPDSPALALTIDTATPAAQIDPVSPDPRFTPVDSIVFHTSEVAFGLDVSDLQLTRDGAAVSIAGATLTSGGGLTWTLENLSGATSPPGTYSFRIDNAAGTITDLAGNVLATPPGETWQVNSPQPQAQVVGRSIFYNNTAYDGRDSAASASDDSAIATDKIALRPGEMATVSNYTNFAGGINGVMVDIANRPAGAGIGVADFGVDVSTDGTSWTPAPAPTVTARPGAGAAPGNDRVTLVWPDNSIVNKWLRVTVKPTAATGLVSSDVFYFGNAVAETGNGAPGDKQANVDASDFFATRDHLIYNADLAPITWRWDFNRDGVTDATDLQLVRANATTTSTALKLIVAP